MSRLSPGEYAAQIHVEGRPVPVVAVVKRQPRNYFSIARKGVSLWLPEGTKEEDVPQHLRKLEAWVSDALAKKPALRELVFKQEKTWETGDIVAVGPRQYTLHVEMEERETHAARLQNGVIHLNLSQKSPPEHREKAIRQLLSRVVAADFLPHVTRRVLDLNRQHFQQNIRSVNLKYSHSRWGSCSSKSNLNLSTRLLFAPPDVQDYVIIHELAHLVELNHSDRFWALVARAMPDYLEKERWLKKHGKQCDF